ncbi:type II toxin-antitoxin system HicB family antitoxin [Paracoccus yeei]|uniref:type II toxin-antitoxin system HicB family antitoxin n=1 Tax=Paracoccus yeei TaxID=147645 RepID=UPI003BF78BBB
MKMKNDSMKYALIVEPAGDGEDGFYAFFPDLPGCMGDGDTPESAIADAREAFDAWMQIQAERVEELPQPGSAVAEVEADRGRIIERIADLERQLEEAKARIVALEADKGRWSHIKSYNKGRGGSMRSAWARTAITA